MSIALITGASAGLGLEYARLFAHDKHDLVLVARRKDKLAEIAAQLSKEHGIKAQVIAADLMEPNAADTIVAEVQRLGLEIEFLVNNAGFGTTGAFIESDARKELGQIHVNITALVALTHALLPGMVKRGHGRVLNIGSTAGFQAGPYMATYYATKAFVNSFTEALWFELKGTGVTATVSCPGATATEFAQVAGNQETRLFKMGAMTSTEVARAGYRAMHAGKPMVVHGFKNKVSVWSSSVTPRPVLRSVVASLNKPPAPQLKAGT
jgi:short-subunit dehydrogenase